jgi:hypothetical protein
VIEILRTAQGLPKSLSVLDVHPVAANPRVEDIGQCMFPEKKIADHPHAFPHLRVRPQRTQLGDRIYCLLVPLEPVEKGREGKTQSCHQLPHLPVILLDEVYYAFSEVFRDVFSVVELLG